MRRPLNFLIALLLIPVSLAAQTAPAQPPARPNPLNAAPQEIPLWDGQAGRRMVAHLAEYLHLPA